MRPAPGIVPFGLPAPSLRRPVLSGFAAALFFVVLAVWSLFADLSSAAVARGTDPVDVHSEPADAAADPAAQGRRLRARIAHLGEEIAWQRALLEAATAQQAFLDTERQNAERLYGEGYARLPRLLEIQLAAAEIEDRKQSARGTIARLREEIAAATQALGN